MCRFTLVLELSFYKLINRPKLMLGTVYYIFRNIAVSNVYIPFPNRDVSTFSTSFFLYPLKLYLKVSEIKRES